MIATPAAQPGTYRTRGHPRAVAAVRAMVAGRMPHALLIGGPSGVGKTTLALDLAAGLLCDATDPTARPCRACRACRLVDRGVHPDLHRLSPVGPGDQIRIGSRDNPEDGSVRRLTIDLALLPVEGRARVAIIERADRLGDDAQTALLKTLEEPPAATTIVLCADDEDRLMPTVRSRCARIRLGPVSARDVEALLADAGLADPPLAARLARLSAGRPGVSQTLARAPDAVAARDELVRILLDLLTAGPARRLSAAREVTARAGDMAVAMAAGAAWDDAAGTSTPSTSRGSAGRGRRRAVQTGAGRGPRQTLRTSDGTIPDPGGNGAAEAEADAESGDGGAVPSASAAERRRAVALAIGLWRELARDLLVVGMGLDREVRDPALLEDLRAAAARAGGTGVPERSAGRGDRHGPYPRERELADFLARLDSAGELLEANVRPELLLDSLLLAWPNWPVPTGSDGEDATAAVAQ